MKLYKGFAIIFSHLMKMVTSKCEFLFTVPVIVILFAILLFTSFH